MLRQLRSKSSSGIGTLKASLRLARLRHTAQVVGIVAVMSGSSHGFSSQTVIAISSAFLASIAIFFLDDARDFESDRIIHLDRPIPEGLITARQAYLIGAALMLGGTLLASALFPYQFAIFLALMAAATAVVFLRLPSALRALLTASIIWALFPFSAFPDLKTVLFGLIVAFPHVGGSITKDFLHSAGDKIQGLKPPPEWMNYVAAFAFIISGLVIWLPVLLGLVTWLYIPPILLTKIACITLAVNVLKRNYERVYTYGRIGMLFALTAVLIEQV